MLQGAPWLIAHKSMLAVDRPFKVSLYGKDYVLWKDSQGNINALENICPHMGAMLSAGWCEAKSDGSSTVVCPFHALEFDAQGCTILPGSNKQTLPLLDPLELIIQGDFIWSYGGEEAKIPIPNILNEIAASYDFVGHTGDCSVETDLRSMLLNMHDYNHQNGTHRELFKITEVQFEKFIDEGHHSHAYYHMPIAPSTLAEKIQNPPLFLMPKVMSAHLENYFPHLIIFHSEMPAGTVAQCHFFIPESEHTTRTYVLLFAQPKHPAFNLMKQQFLDIVKVVVDQDAAILSKIYPDAQRKIKLNNEVGMDWVDRNYYSFPSIDLPNLSKSYSRL
jgi:phenylpropionate dioxygenase-like ring-hydroxylating dioxygenase large terminal subunit